MGIVDPSLTNQEKADLLVDKINTAKKDVARNPGVIWIANERIEYWGVEQDPLQANNFILTGVLRGTGSTSQAAPVRASQILYEAPAGTTLPILNGSSVSWNGSPDHVYVLVFFEAPGKSTYVRRLELGSEYSIIGNNVELNQAIFELDVYSPDYQAIDVFVRVQESDWMTPDVVTHAQGKNVYDGSVIQHLPIDYKLKKIWPANGSEQAHVDVMNNWRNFLDVTAIPGPSRIN
jgi:hypothetical protein